MKPRFFIIGPLPPPAGGIAVFIERRLAELEADGENVSIRDWKRMGILRRIGWVAEIIFRPGLCRFEFHAYETWPMAAVRIRLFPARVVYYLHSARILYVLNRYQLMLARHFVARADGIVMVSPAVRDTFVEAGWKLPANLSVQASWIPPDRSREQALFESYPADLREFMSSHRPLMVVQGSEGWHKGDDLYGTDLAIDLLIEARRTRPGVGLLIARPSPGSAIFRDYTRSLESRLFETGCRDAVYVMELSLPLWPAIAKADLLLRPTADDGDSISVREALMLGTPVVASDAAPRPEGVVLFRSRDLADLARVVLGHPVFSGLNRDDGAGSQSGFRTDGGSAANGESASDGGSGTDLGSGTNDRSGTDPEP